MLTPGTSSSSVGSILTWASTSTSPSTSMPSSASSGSSGSGDAGGGVDEKAVDAGDALDIAWLATEEAPDEVVETELIDSRARLRSAFGNWAWADTNSIRVRPRYGSAGAVSGAGARARWAADGTQRWSSSVAAGGAAADEMRFLSSAAAGSLRPVHSWPSTNENTNSAMVAAVHLERRL